MKNRSTEWIHCNQCLRKTKQKVVVTRKFTETETPEDDLPVEYVTINTLFQCNGCGYVTLKRRVVSNDIDMDVTEYFPPPISRQAPKWICELPEEMSALLTEIYTALHSNSKRLAMMGARAVVDMFMNREIGDIGGFDAKLNHIVKKGYMSQKNRTVLEAVLDAGHAASHRAYSPSKPDMILVLDIVENLVHSLLFQNKTKELRKNTPQRR